MSMAARLFGMAQPCRCLRISRHLLLSRSPSFTQTRSRHMVVLAAKKKKSGSSKGGGQKKGAGSLADIPKPPEPWKDPEVIMENLLLVESFRRKVGRPLLEGELEIQEIAETLWKAPMAILSSNDGDSDGEPPVYKYANEVALALFGFSKLEDMLDTPCATTTAQEEQAQADRGSLMAGLLEKGSQEVGLLKRQTSQGQPVELTEATLWAVEAPTGETTGSGIVIYKWIDAAGKQRGPRAEPSEESQESTAEPSADLAAAEAAAAEQAQAVRELKEGKGLDNDSPEVQAAVEELLKRKAAVEEMK